MAASQKVMSQVYNCHMALAPIADAFAGTVTTSPINCSGAKSITYLVYWGVGATGTSTYTVEACDDTSASNTSAVPFQYKRAASAVSTNVWGAITDATTSGFLSTAGSAQAYMIEVDCDALAHVGYKYCRLKAVEGTANARLGGIFEFLNVDYPRDIHATALT